MKSYYELRDRSVVSTSPEAAQIRVYATPDNAEKQELINTLHIDPHDLESALDPDEISRADITPEYTYIVWKRPNNVSFEQEMKFEVSSVGVYLRAEGLTLILGESTLPFAAREFQNVSSLSGVVLKFFLHTIHHFLGHLKAIKQINGELQSKLNLTMENRYLVQMFTLGESLIYYLNALEANSAVLTKLRANADKLGFSREELEMIDDIMIEHQQCTRQTQIYSSVLSGLMDARGNIVNNNMNILLRNLTLINVVFLPLNLIAGIGGMSEFSMMTTGVHWATAYAFLLMCMAVLGWATWKFLMKKLDLGRLAIKRTGMSKSRLRRVVAKTRF
jgi:magnesium transporter